MINRHSPTFKFVVDYIAIPSIFLTIFVYCGLIFVSRSFLGAMPTLLLIALGIFAAALLGRGVVELKRQERES